MNGWGRGGGGDGGDSTKPSMSQTLFEHPSILAYVHTHTSIHTHIHTYIPFFNEAINESTTFCTSVESTDAPDAEYMNTNIDIHIDTDTRTHP